jgi:hypothetical protein
MPRRWRVALQRVLTAGVALAFLAGPASMAAMDDMPASPTTAHGGHHSGGSGHQHGNHQQTDCCDSCATHCAGQEVVAPAVVHAAEASIDRAPTFESYPQPIPQNPQLRLPPSQGPPTALL